jgi:hypothetical protein
MEIEDAVGVRFGIENEVDMEEKGRGWDLEGIAGDSLTVTRHPTCALQPVASSTKRCLRFRQCHGSKGNLLQNGGRCSFFSQWKPANRTKLTRHLEAKTRLIAAPSTVDSTIHLASSSGSMNSPTLMLPMHACEAAYNQARLHRLSLKRKKNRERQIDGHKLATKVQN